MGQDIESKFENLNRKVGRTVDKEDFHEIIQGLVEKEAFEELQVSTSEMGNDYDGFKSSIQNNMTSFTDRLKDLDDKVATSGSSNSTLVSESISELKEL
jgi:outer membrane protein assembly factor BamA